MLGNTDTIAPTSAVKIDDLSGKRFENSNDGQTNAAAIVSPSGYD